MTQLSDSRNRVLLRILKGLVVASVLLQVGLLFRPSEDFLRRPIVEDAYYSLAVARSIAGGAGFSVDGVRPTNGVQPLICVLYAPVYLLFPDDPVTPLRGVLLIDILIGIAGAVLFGRLLVDARRDTRRLPEELLLWSGIAAYLVNYSLSTHLLNGLETGLTLVMLLLVTRYVNRILLDDERFRPGFGQSAILGLLIGLAVLVRIDAVILGAAVVLVYVGYRTRAGGIGFSDLNRIAVVGAVALLVSSPWWIYNVVEFGNPLPVSGQSQADLAPGLLPVVSATASVLFDALLPGIHTPTGWETGSVAVTGLILPAVIFLLFVTSGRVRTLVNQTIALLRTSWDWRRVIPIAVAAALYLIAYTFFFAAPHFQPRYLLTLRILGTIFFAILFLTLIARRDGRTGGIAVAAFCTLLLVSVPLMARNYIGLYSNIMLDPLAWVREHTGPGERIGMFQSGTVGYFFPDRVVNLDGKVNVDAHRHFRAGTLGGYVDSMDFAYIIDWDLYTDRVFSGPGSIREAYVPVDTLRWSGMIVWKRVGSNPLPESAVE